MSSFETKPKTSSKRRPAGSADVYLQDWDGLRAFLYAAREGSISVAAALHRVQHSTLSRRIAALERQIGRPLLERSSRGIHLTPDGVELLRVLERFDEDLGAVGRWITRGVRGAVRPISVNISCTEGLAAYWLTHFLPVLRQRNAPACFNIHTAIAATPEKGKAFHAAVQMHQPAGAERPEQLGSIHFCAMASRAYVEELGSYRGGDHPGDHRWIEYAPFRVMSGSWETWFQKQKIEVAPFTVTNSLVTTVNAVREGVGIGLLPTYMAITMPELVPIDVGLRLRFPIWMATDPQSQDTPELSAATGLIRAAIDVANMPWFAERYEPDPDYDAWRDLMKIAVQRLA